MLALIFFSVMAFAQSPPQQQSESAAVASATQTKAQELNQTRASALNSTVANCPKCKPLTRDTSAKPLGRTTVKDFKGRKVEVSVVSEELAIKLFQQLTVQDGIPFGYPEDGCYARAHEMAYQLDKQKILTAKVIATGRFVVETEKAADGIFAWAWHIAPAIIVDHAGKQELWVIDPSLFFEPVPLEKWLSGLTAHPKSSLKSTYLASRFTYHPDRRNRELKGFDDEELAAARRVMKRYLKRENLRGLQKSPDL